MPAAGALIGKYHRNATISLATGIHLSGVMAGAVLSGTGGWLAERHGWRFPFELFGPIGVGYAIVLMVLLRDPKEEGNPQVVAAQKEVSAQAWAKPSSICSAAGPSCFCSFFIPSWA